MAVGVRTLVTFVELGLASTLKVSALSDILRLDCDTLGGVC